MRGPYPAGLVSRYILLGRLHESDEVSKDGHEWRKIKDVPDLIPKILRGDTSDPLFQERLQAARRWADERNYDRRAEALKQDVVSGMRQGGERREMEEMPTVTHRLSRLSREQESLAGKQGVWNLSIAFGVLAVALGLFLINYSPRPPALGSDCQSPAAPRVNWSNCVLDGVHAEEHDLTGAIMYSASLTGANFRRSTLTGSNLSYAGLSISNLSGADMRHAILTGANLRGANLSGALLDDADLSYADLKGANLAGASLNHAKLANVIWVDGKRCLPQSIGGCQTAP